MSEESDTLAVAAKQFSEAVRAERTATIDVLEKERKSALKVIEALQKEQSKKARGSSGKVILSLTLGLALGAAAVWYFTRAEEEPNFGLKMNVSDVQANLKERFQAALSAGKQAATAREQELWTQFRVRLPKEV